VILDEYERMRKWRRKIVKWPKIWHEARIETTKIWDSNQLLPENVKNVKETASGPSCDVVGFRHKVYCGNYPLRIYEFFRSVLSRYIYFDIFRYLSRRRSNI
jgi:hypothetical protein